MSDFISGDMSIRGEIHKSTNVTNRAWWESENAVDDFNDLRLFEVLAVVERERVR